MVNKGLDDTGLGDVSGHQGSGNSQLLKCARVASRQGELGSTLVQKGGDFSTQPSSRTDDKDGSSAEICHGSSVAREAGKRPNVSECRFAPTPPPEAGPRRIQTQRRSERSTSR